MLGVIVQLLMTTGLSPASAQNAGYFSKFQQGYVYTRALVLGPSGAPIFAEYDAGGSVVKVIGEAVGPYAQARVYAASDYRANLSSYDQLRSQAALNGTELRVYTLAQYQQASDAELPVKHVLLDASLSVVVNSAGDVLLQSPIDLTAPASLSDTSTALLLSAVGQVIYQAHQPSVNIAYRAAYFHNNDPNSSSDDDRLLDAGSDIDKDANAQQSTGQIPWGPLRGVRVYSTLPVPNGTASDDAGHYALNYTLPPCPGFDFDYTHTLIAEIPYRSFNPRGESYGAYYASATVYDYCPGAAFGLPPGFDPLAQDAQYDAQAIIDTQATPVSHLNLEADIVLLSGAGIVQNPDGTSVQAGATEYRYDPPDLTPQALQNLDLNSDGQADYAQLCGDRVRVWFAGPPHGEPCSDDPPPDPAADLTRAPDTLPDTNDQGLLEALSSEDLQSTDLYVFRVANGQLLSERRNLSLDETVAYNGGGVFSDNDNPGFFYKLAFRGPRYGDLLGGDLLSWQQSTQLNPELQGQQSDFLKPGELVKLIAINRRTGYIGSLTTNVQTLQNPQALPALVLRPPQLKIWAERDYAVQAGATQGEDRHYLISDEGSGLSSDTVIRITSEWVDSDGSALPSGLPGYTGRLAKILETGVVGESAGQVAHFSVQPGRHLQLIRLQDQNTAREHFYVQVAAEPIERNPDFSEPNGAGAGALQYRPAHYVPFQVPVLDEPATLDRRLGANDPKSIPAVYAWPYRPELQFSVFQLQNIVLQLPPLNGDDADSPVAGANGQPQSIDLSQGPDHPIDLLNYLLSVDSVTLLYQINGPAFDPLQALGPSRELVFSLGGEESGLATLNGQGQWVFTNPQSLSQLSATEWFALLLYQNNDSENVLWEYALETLDIGPTLVDDSNWTEDEYIVSADDPQVELYGAVNGYSLRDPSQKTGLVIDWAVSGSGGIADEHTPLGSEGTALNLLRMSPVAGVTASVTATFAEKGILTSARFASVRVVPGKPARIISAEPSGTAYVSGAGQVSLSWTVYDRNANLVEDGTEVQLSVGGGAQLSADKAYTEHGVISAVLSGGDYAGAVTVSAQVGNSDSVKVDQTVDIQPLNVELQLAGDPHVNGIQTVGAYVTGSGGAVAGATVSFYTSVGKLETTQAVTDSQGHAQVELHGGFYPADGMLQARVGQGNLGAVDLHILPRAGAPQVLDTRRTLVIGDQSEDGVVPVTAYDEAHPDGFTVQADYQARAPVLLSGTPGAMQTVTLGSLSDPNLAPIASWTFNQPLGDEVGVVEETGLHTGQPTGLSLVRDHPLGIGYSAVFSPTALKLDYDGDGTPDQSLPSHMNVEYAQAFEAVKPGFRVDIKLQSGGGTVFDLGGGTHRLSVTAQGGLLYQVATTDGLQSIEVDPLSLNAWHTVAGRYDGQYLLLEVDGQPTQKIASGTMRSIGSGSLSVGDTLDARLSGLRLYDWARPALLQLQGSADHGGIQSASINLDAEGHGQLQISSYGLLNAGEINSAINTLRVLLTAGGDHQYAGVIATAAYANVASQYLNSQVDDPAQYAYNDTPWLNVIGIGRAEAAPSLWGTLLGIVNFFIPYEDVFDLFKQLSCIGQPCFDPVKLAYSALSTASIVVPFLKPAARLLKPFRALLPVLRDGKGLAFVKGLGGFIGNAVQKAYDSRSFNVVLNYGPLLLSMLEMLDEEGGIDQLQYLAELIRSEDDLQVIFDLFYNPPGGDIDSEAQLTLVAQADTSASLYAAADWFIGSAHAQSSKSKVARLVGKRLLSFLKGIRQYASAAQLPDEEIIVVMKIARDLINAVKKDRNKNFAQAVAEFRKYLYNPKLWRALFVAQTKLIRGNIGSFIKGYDGRRASLPELVFVMAYIGDQMLADDGKLRDPALQQKIATLIATALVDISEQQQALGCNSDPLQDVREQSDDDVAAVIRVLTGRLSNANGALFQLSQIADLVLSGKQVVDIERVQKMIKLQGHPTFSLNRRIDIVSGDDKWVETKSIAARKITGSGVGTDTFTKGFVPFDVVKFAKGGNPNREFFLDQLYVARLGKGTANVADTKMEWRFQYFELANDKGCPYYGSKRTGIQNADLTAAKDLLLQMPKGLSNTDVSTNFGYPSWSVYSSAFRGNKTVISKRMVDLFSFAQAAAEYVIEEDQPGP